MAGFNDASDYAKFAMILLVFNFVVHIISFGAPFWTTRVDGNAGLWEGCTDGVCYERWNQWVAGWIKAAQTCMVLTVITLFTATVLVFLYVFQRSFDNDKRLVAVALACTGLSGLFTLIAVITWAAGEHLSSGEALNWPYALGWLSAICSLVAVPALWKELRSEDLYSREVKAKRLQEDAAVRRGKEMGVGSSWGPGAYEGPAAQNSHNQSTNTFDL